MKTEMIWRTSHTEFTLQNQISYENVTELVHLCRNFVHFSFILLGFGLGLGLEH